MKFACGILTRIVCAILIGTILKEMTQRTKIIPSTLYMHIYIDTYFVKMCQYTRIKIASLNFSFRKKCLFSM